MRRQSTPRDVGAGSQDRECRPFALSQIPDKGGYNSSAFFPAEGIHSSAPTKVRCIWLNAVMKEKAFAAKCRPFADRLRGAEMTNFSLESEIRNSQHLSNLSAI